MGVATTVYPLTGAWAQCEGGGDHHTLTLPRPDPRHDTLAGGHDGAEERSNYSQQVSVVLCFQLLRYSSLPIIYSKYFMLFNYHPKYIDPSSYKL